MKAMTLRNLQSTSDDGVAGTVRLVLAVLFVMTGAMKLLVPMLGDAFAGQLLAADLPLYAISRWTVPFLEIVLGVALAVGLVQALVLTRDAVAVAALLELLRL